MIKIVEVEVRRYSGSMDIDLGYFIYNKQNSKALHVFIQDRPDLEAPKRRVTFMSPNGYEGELAYDDEGYETTEFELECFYDGRQHGDHLPSVSVARNDIYTLFNQGKGEWVDFIPYYDPEHIYKVMLTEITFENKYYFQGCIKFKAKFKCQPYKYLIQTSTTQVATNQVVPNPTKYKSRPIVKIPNMTGNLTIQVGSTVLKVNELKNESLVIDSQRYVVYNQNGSTITNKNSKTVGKDFFEFYPGSDSRNRVTFSATNGSAPSLIEVIPNWRVLV